LRWGAGLSTHRRRGPLRPDARTMPPEVFHRRASSRHARSGETLFILGFRHRPILRSPGARAGSGGTDPRRVDPAGAGGLLRLHLRARTALEPPAIEACPAPRNLRPRAGLSPTAARG